MNDWWFGLPWEEFIIPIITFGFRAPWAMALVSWRRREITKRINAKYGGNEAAADRAGDIPL